MKAGETLLNKAWGYWLMTQNEKNPVPKTPDGGQSPVMPDTKSYDHLAEMSGTALGEVLTMLHGIETVLEDIKVTLKDMDEHGTAWARRQLIPEVTEETKVEQ